MVVPSNAILGIEASFGPDRLTFSSVVPQADNQSSSAGGVRGTVGVGVGVDVGVGVGVDVDVGVGVLVGVGASVAVGAAVGAEVGDGISVGD